MQEDKVELQEVFRILPRYNGAYLEVLVDEDGMVRVQTKGQESERYFGKVNFSIEPRVANKLADALKALAKDKNG